MSTYMDEVRTRLNPRRMNLTDVMVRGTGIQRRWLFRRQRGAGKWSALLCWLVGVACGLGLIFLVYVLLVCLAIGRV